MEMVMQLILYGILVIILAVVGYYLADAMKQNHWLGAGIGAAAGAMISAGIWYASSEKFGNNFVY